MEILREIKAGVLSPTCVAVGVFDGVHVGHQAVLRQAVAGAREAGLVAAALTFDPHPERVLRPRQAPLLLTTLPERAALIAETGIEALVVAQFDRAFASLTAEEFAHCVLVEQLAARCVVAGDGFVFGRGARGNAAILAELGRKLGFEASAVKRVAVDDTEVSSTVVRQLISSGNIERAAVLLGHYYTIRGSVTPGDRRGRELGFPTANLCVSRDKLLPPHGVYAVWARIEGRAECERSGASDSTSAPDGELDPPRRIDDERRPAIPAVANVGVRPTFPANRTRPSDPAACVEAHVLEGEPGDLYDRTITLDLVTRLREERAFPDGQALQEQIRRDIAQARRALSSA
ncbi:MAG: bifunctional riboflavin kinase/FAD synthetase [Armatimonadota bacterium]|nr:MAG: bifunctional riboflavin kinase/FAD synthetase [Armatimonadota bacterium]